MGGCGLCPGECDGMCGKLCGVAGRSVSPALAYLPPVTARLVSAGIKFHRGEVDNRLTQKRSAAE